MEKQRAKLIKSEYANPWLYFAVVFVLSWIFWIPAALLGRDFGTPAVTILFLLGGIFGKAVPNVILPFITFTREGQRDFWTRVVDVSRPGLLWWAITLFSMPLSSGLAIATHLVLGGELPSFETALQYLADPAALAGFAVVTFFMGPFFEELGWTGYEIDRLQSRWGGLTTGLVLGVFWGLWHLPLFFIRGSWHHDEVGLFTLQFWLSFMLGILAVQLLMTWIYNNTNRSTLSGIMLHFMVNFTGEFLDLPQQLEYYRAAWMIVFAVAVVWFTRGDLGKSKLASFYSEEV